MAAKLRFYLDENVPIALAVQLKRRGIEAVTVRDLGLLTALYEPADMENHIEYL